ncbi:Protein of unknown function [Gryllus bimaculatus]|nr:Protein of unknown function [Gryllus bimaculatus]
MCDLAGYWRFDDTLEGIFMCAQTPWRRSPAWCRPTRPAPPPPPRAWPEKAAATAAAGDGRCFPARAKQSAAPQAKSKQGETRW